MRFELTEEDRIRVQQGQPVDVIDPQTNQAYVLIAKPRFEELSPPTSVPETEAAPEPEIPEGIRLSQEAFRRELPELLKTRLGDWVGYHGNERIGIARTGHPLLAECLRRGLADDEYYLGWIHPSGLIEEEVVEP